MVCVLRGGGVCVLVLVLVVLLPYATHAGV